MHGLETSGLTDLMFHVLEGNLFSPRLTYGVERSLYASILIMSLTLLALSFPVMTLMQSTLMVLKGVNLCLSCSLLPHVCLARSLSAHAPSHSPERIGWMVLKGLRCNSLVPPWSFAIYFQAMVLKIISGVGVHLCFLWLRDFETFLHNTQMRPNVVLAACPVTISFGILVSTT